MLQKAAFFASALILGAVGNTYPQDSKQASKSESVKFTVTIENISKENAMKAKDGTRWSFALSPGLCIVHTNNAPVFSEGKKDRGKGLERQAEEGNPAALAESLKSEKGVKSATLFNVPIDTSVPAPITPGFAYKCSFEASPGDKLTITSMFGQSNDLFYAPGESGIALFTNGKPIAGDITSKMILWDGGTEVHEEPGVGPNQAPRQQAPNTGKEENGVVKNIKNVKDGFSYPKTTTVMKITISPESLSGAK
jgi:hypothetical protein